MELQTFLVALALACIHVLAGRLRFLEVTPRSIWLSTAGGASVAYVFLHILPDLAEGQQHFRSVSTGWLAAIERHVWLLALAGLSAFYGLETLVRQSRVREGSGDEHGPAVGVFWLHIGSFAVYNLLFGYLLRHQERGETELTLYGVAIGLHFIVNDYGLRSAHRRAYDRIARWLLAGAVVVGWAVGSAIAVHEIGVAAVFALLAGGIVLNVLKEELPEERQSRFWAFATGAAGYAVLLALAG